jgi:hypothetical protein
VQAIRPPSALLSIRTAASARCNEAKAAEKMCDRCEGVSVVLHFQSEYEVVICLRAIGRTIVGEPIGFQSIVRLDANQMMICERMPFRMWARSEQTEAKMVPYHWQTCRLGTASVSQRPARFTLRPLMRFVTLELSIYDEVTAAVLVRGNNKITTSDCVDVVSATHAL